MKKKKKKKKKREINEERSERQKHENKNIFQNEKGVRFQVAHVPKRHCFVRTSRGQDEFINGIECNAIDVSVMRIFHDMHRLVWILFADIPNHEFLVITDTANHVGIAFVPVHIFNDICVTTKDANGLDLSPSARLGVRNRGDIPKIDRAILTATEEASLVVVGPRKPVSFHAVTETDALRTKGRVIHGKGRMLAQVPNVNLGAGSACGHNKVILWHVAGTVDFSLMLDLHADLNLPNTRVGMAEPPELLLLFVIVGRMCGGLAFSAVVDHRIVLWKIDGPNHEIVLFSSCMGSQEE
jgi:hypothetical protein